MHPYSITNGSRHKTIMYLTLVSVALATGAGALIAGAGLSSFIGAPTGAAIFGGVFLLFDRYLWRISVLGLSLTPIPDLNGAWSGKIDLREGKGAGSKFLEEETCTVRIQQTWSRISIGFSTHEATRSSSVMASLGPPEDNNGGLRYEYDVTPKPGGRPLAQRETVRHLGTAHLSPESNRDWRELNGDYYNDKDSQLWGTYHLTRDE